MKFLLLFLLFLIILNRTILSASSQRVFSSISTLAYTEFLNKAAVTDPHHYYDEKMESPSHPLIWRQGEPGSYCYFSEENTALPFLNCKMADAFYRSQKKCTCCEKDDFFLKRDSLLEVDLALQSNMLFFEALDLSEEDFFSKEASGGEESSSWQKITLAFLGLAAFCSCEREGNIEREETVTQENTPMSTPVMERSSKTTSPYQEKIYCHHCNQWNDPIPGGNQKTTLCKKNPKTGLWDPIDSHWAESSTPLLQKPSSKKRGQHHTQALSNF